MRRPDSISLAVILNSLLVWAVLFPFIPSIARSSDTQPTFLLVFLLAVLIGFALPSVASEMMRLSFPGVTIALTVALVLYGLLIAANLSEIAPTIPSRLFSFLQFGAAGLWAYTGKYEWNLKTLYRAMVIYVVFTGVYFLTGGLVENILIHSRASLSGSLFASGRGARTLSPEPSFFALQVFNIYVLSRLVDRRETPREPTRRRFLILVACCLLSSFSVYGALVLLLVLAAEYPRVVALSAIGLISVTGIAYPFLTRWESVRAVGFILALFNSGGDIAKLILMDASLASRIHSFSAYASAFAEHPWTGNGFSLFQGGGFISIIAAFGIVGLVFFVWAVGRLATVKRAPATKALLFFWFALNFISGPIGIPIIGMILGRALSDKGLGARKRARRLLNPQPALLT